MILLVSSVFDNVWASESYPGLKPGSLRTLWISCISKVLSIRRRASFLRLEEVQAFRGRPPVCTIPIGKTSARNIATSLVKRCGNFDGALVWDYAKGGWIRQDTWWPCLNMRKEGLTKIMGDGYSVHITGISCPQPCAVLHTTVRSCQLLSTPFFVGKVVHTIVIVI